MKCPGCGTEIANPGKFCGVCGRPLSQRLCPNGHVMAEGAETCPICATTKHPIMPATPPAVGKVSTVHTPDKGKTLFEIGAWQDVKPAEPPPGGGAGDILFETGGPGPGPIAAAPAAVSSPGGVRKTRMLGSDAAPSEAGLMGWLVAGPDRRDGRDLRLMVGRNTVGASPKNDIVLDEDSVSSNHAAVVCQAGAVWVEDNNSTNGTSVNGQRVQRMELAEGDTVQFGTFTVVFSPFRKKA
ncbi:MAG: FHA domain-containing protein [Deltaproteobacteria bacterium]|nr:FHA domain-containing protein [Deltaproteobacteria bacterium]